jgi:hypothetical protein
MKFFLPLVMASLLAAVSACSPSLATNSSQQKSSSVSTGNSSSQSVSSTSGTSSSVALTSIQNVKNSPGALSVTTPSPLSSGVKLSLKLKAASRNLSGLFAIRKKDPSATTSDSYTKLTNDVASMLSYQTAISYGYAIYAAISPTFSNLSPTTNTIAFVFNQKMYNDLTNTLDPTVVNDPIYAPSNWVGITNVVTYVYNASSLANYDIDFTYIGTDQTFTLSLTTNTNALKAQLYFNSLTPEDPDLSIAFDRTLNLDTVTSVQKTSTETNSFVLSISLNSASASSLDGVLLSETVNSVSTLANNTSIFNLSIAGTADDNGGYLSYTATSKVSGIAPIYAYYLDQFDVNGNTTYESTSSDGKVWSNTIDNSSLNNDYVMDLNAATNSTNIVNTVPPDTNLLAVDTAQPSSFRIWFTDLTVQDNDYFLITTNMLSGDQISNLCGLSSDIDPSDPSYPWNFVTGQGYGTATNFVDVTLWDTGAYYLSTNQFFYRLDGNGTVTEITDTYVWTNYDDTIGDTNYPYTIENYGDDIYQTNFYEDEWTPDPNGYEIVANWETMDTNGDWQYTVLGTGEYVYDTDWNYIGDTNEPFDVPTQIDATSSYVIDWNEWATNSDGTWAKDSNGNYIGVDDGYETTNYLSMDIYTDFTMYVIDSIETDTNIYDYWSTWTQIYDLVDSYNSQNFMTNVVYDYSDLDYAPKRSAAPGKRVAVQVNPSQRKASASRQTPRKSAPVVQTLTRQQSLQKAIDLKKQLAIQKRNDVQKALKAKIQKKAHKKAPRKAPIKKR